MRPYFRQFTSKSRFSDWKVSWAVACVRSSRIDTPRGRFFFWPHIPSLALYDTNFTTMGCGWSPVLSDPTLCLLDINQAGKSLIPGVSYVRWYKRHMCLANWMPGLKSSSQRHTKLPVLPIESRSGPHQAADDFVNILIKNSDILHNLRWIWNSDILHNLRWIWNVTTRLIFDKFVFSTKIFYRGGGLVHSAWHDSVRHSGITLACRKDIQTYILHADALYSLPVWLEW